MALGLPYINVKFEEQASASIQRNARGIVALVLEDLAPQVGVTIVRNIKDIPAGLNQKNKNLVELCLKGGTNAPEKIILSVVATGKSVEGVSALELKEFNWLATPYATTENKASIITIVETFRTKGSGVKYVVANTKVNKHYVVNFTTGNIATYSGSFTTDEFTARIVGLLAGTPLSISATYQTLPDVAEVQSYTKDDLDTKIANGEFIIFHDGRKVKVARGVTGLTEPTSETPSAFKKIKVTSIADVIRADVSKTIEDLFIGKYPNSYDNKMLIVTAIKGYLDTLAREELLDSSFENACEIDIEAQKVYLQSVGIDVEAMSNDDIKMHNTHDKLFLIIRCKILDAIEEVDIVVNI